MTDDFGSLRQAMSDLSEHGGTTDMYERSLRRSRQSQRRIAATTTAAAVVVATGVVLTVADRPDPSAPVAGPGTASPSSPTCPAAGTLEQLIELPAGWSFLPAAAVQCSQGWATVAVKRPAPGAFAYLFHYQPGTGWRYYDQGSSWACKDLDLTEPAPFCTS